MAIFFLILVDLKAIEEPTAIQNARFIKDFTNLIDLARIDQALKDEGVYLKVLKPEWAFINS